MATIATYQNIDMDTLYAKLKEIREKITKDEFCICNRQKNEKFKRKFRFTKKNDFKNVLLKLTSNDFFECAEEEEPTIYGDGIVYIFLKECTLYNFYGERETVIIYIKIKIPDKTGDLPVISFHESEY